jgi:hypothetical protein
MGYMLCFIFCYAGLWIKEINPRKISRLLNTLSKMLSVGCFGWAFGRRTSDGVEMGDIAPALSKIATSANKDVEQLENELAELQLILAQKLEQINTANVVEAEANNDKGLLIENPLLLRRAKRASTLAVAALSNNIQPQPSARTATAPPQPPQRKNSTILGGLDAIRRDGRFLTSK